MKTYRSKSNFRAKPSSKVQSISKKYGILELPKAVSVPIYDASAQAIFDNMGTSPDITRKENINTCVSGLKTDGVWAILDRLFVFAAHAEDSSLIDWINPAGTAATNLHETSFVIDEGYTSDGTNDYININYNPVDDGVNATQNSISSYHYCRNNPDVNSGRYIYGAGDAGGNYHVLNARYTSTTSRLAINNAPTNIGLGITTNMGGFTLSRDNSANWNLAINGGSYNNTAGPSVGLCGADYHVLSYNENGITNASKFLGQISVFAVGGSLTVTQSTALNTRIETFMVAIGSGVQ